MKKIFLKEWVQYLFLFLLILCSRIPFLDDGYGLDGDSWSVAISARQLHDSGIYEVSRLPGFPLHEWLTSLVISGGPFFVNLLTAFVSSLGFLFFAWALRTLHFRKIFLATLALAFVPIVFIHSTTTIDYNFALAFLLAGFFFTVNDRPLPAGIMLGLAIGCRITSGAMLVPFIIMILQNDGLRKNLVRVFKLTFPALLFGGLSYVPVYLKYGSDFFSYYNVPYPSIPKVLYKLSVETWGIIGFAGLIISVVLFFLTSRKVTHRYLFPRSVNEKFVVAWLMAIDLYIIAFLKLPMESGYLIPIIPFVILIFGKYLYDRAFVFLCCTLIISSFFCSLSPDERFDASTVSPVSFGLNAGGESLVFDVLKGPIINYHSRRVNGASFVKKIAESLDTVTKASVLVSGRWYNQLLVCVQDTGMGKMEIESYVDEPKVVQFFAKGFVLYYLPRQDYYNQLMRGVDLHVYGAVPYLAGSRF